MILWQKMDKYCKQDLKEFTDLIAKHFYPATYTKSIRCTKCMVATLIDTGVKDNACVQIQFQVLSIV